MMHKGKYIYSFFYLLVLFALTSCSPSLAVKARTDRSADIQFVMDTGPVLTQTIRAMGALGGMTDSTPLFSTDTIATVRNSFKDSDFSDVSVSVPSPTSLKISATITPPEKQKGMGGDIKAANFVTCTANSLTIILSPQTMRTLAASLPNEARESLDLFMAPIFTGEQMTAEEYKGLIAAVYGQDLAEELEQSSIKMTLAPPDGYTIAKSSLSETETARTSASKASFSIPLVEFFTLQNARTFSISW